MHFLCFNYRMYTEHVNNEIRIPLTCLGITPGMRISNAKSDESTGITGLVVPRHSLENDLVVSLNLKKEDNFNILEHNGILCSSGREKGKKKKGIL